MAAPKRALLVALFVALVRAAGAGTVVGNGGGTVPDGGPGAFPSYGLPLVISFTVSGVAAPISSLALDIKLTHTSAGELDMVLRAPGGAPSLPLVSLVGVTGPAAVGDSSNFSGRYGFSDAAAGANIWTVAGGACGTACDILPGSYRSTGPGGPGQTDPPQVTSLNATFGGLTPLLANGTWTLEIRDAAQLNVGTVTGARLFIDTPLTEIVFEDGFDVVPCTEADEGCPTAIELERLRQGLATMLESGVCVPQGEIGNSSSSGFDYCYTNACPGATRGCHLTSQVVSLEAAAAGLGRATVDVVFDVSGIVPLDGALFSCNLNVLAPQQRLRSEIAYQLDAGTARYTVTSETRSIAPSFDEWDLSNCSIISSLGNLVTMLLDAFAGSYLQSLTLVGLEF